LCASSYLIRVIKSKSVTWTGRVARTGDTTNEYKVLVWNSEGKSYLGDVGVNGSIILKLILGKLVVILEVGLARLGTVSSCEL